MPEFTLRNCKIAVVGLGYVGLPLAVEFGKRSTRVGFDINKRAHRRAAARAATSTLEIDAGRTAARQAPALHAPIAADLRDCNVFIVTVPTPIDEHKRPDLSAARSAPAAPSAARSSPATSSSSNRPSIPARPRKICVPILERVSGLKFNRRFLRRLQPRAHQPGRQGAPPDDDHEGHLGLDAARPPISSTRCIARSSPPARTRRRASASPKRPR